VGRAVYSEQEREAALDLVREFGLAEAWRRSPGIPKPTLASWAQRAGVRSDAAAKTAVATEAAEARAKQLRAELRVGLLEKAVDLLQRMDAEHVDFKGKDVEQVTYPIAPAGAVQNYATSVGILIDKYRLEAGEATTRNESRDITHDDHEAAILRDVLQRELARRSEQPDASEGAVEAAVAGDPTPQAGAA
jgi:hypothetical protein